MKRAICWLRRDLRTVDHAPLHLATTQAEEVVVVFVYDTIILDALEDRDDRRLTFIHRSLDEVDAFLRERGSALVTLRGDPIHEIPKLAKELEAEAVFAGDDYEPYAESRDKAVDEALREMGKRLKLVKDHVIFQRDEIVKDDDTAFRVYSPYRKRWMQFFDESMAAPHDPNYSNLIRFDQLPPHGNRSYDELGFVENDLWLTPGMSGAQSRLHNFEPRMSSYASKRDFPHGDHTSGLSVHLRHGTISVRECVRSALNQESKGSDKWLAEIVWREFYQMILALHPHVVERNFNPQYDSIEWPGSSEEFAKWYEGETGYPIVDAAMKCFNATGWMHNRLRMVVASFLTKDLLCDWRWGEEYFARKLLDFDLAQNNGGWQWAASTGVDAQPYFRIFNPILQGKKFDSEGNFVREWLPKLANLPSSKIHAPWEADRGDLLMCGLELEKDYPLPMVDHGERRERAIRLLESAKR